MNFIISKEEYLNVIAAWNKISNRDTTDHIFYNVLRGHDPKRGFSPVQSPIKLANGQTPWLAFEQAKSSAVWQIRSHPVYAGDTPARLAARNIETKERLDNLSRKFGVEFTPELIAKIQEVLK